MRKINDRDIDFVLNAAIIALIIMAVIHAISPIVAPEPDRSKEVQAYMKDVVPLSSEAVDAKLKGKPHMLMIYASWCTYCRGLMPTVVELIQKKELGNIEPVILSLDKDPGKMAAYLVKNNYNGVITPYVVENGVSGGLPAVLGARGSNFTGGIPYIGFFNSDGKLVAETLGMVNKERLLAAVQKAKAQ